MRLLADEGVDRHIVERLRRDGHQVDYVAEIHPGVPDAVVQRMATSAQMLLLTQDKDFGEMVYRRQVASVGVLLLRLARLSGPAKADLVASALLQHAGDMAGAFSVLSPGSIRIRHLPGCEVRPAAYEQQEPLNDPSCLCCHSWGLICVQRVPSRGFSQDPPPGPGRE